MNLCQCLMKSYTIKCLQTHSVIFAVRVTHLLVHRCSAQCCCLSCEVVAVHSAQSSLKTTESPAHEEAQFFFNGRLDFLLKIQLSKSTW